MKARGKGIRTAGATNGSRKVRKLMSSKVWSMVQVWAKQRRAKQPGATPDAAQVNALSSHPPVDPSMSFSLVVQRAPDQPRLDLGRNVHCLFGLVFDAITLDEATEQLRRDVRAQRPCFFSTPNVNFVAGAQIDEAFRNSVLRSDLSVVDGMPIVWAARLMGIPIRERIAGSDVFERLRHAGSSPLKVFFFGGPDGVAERAVAALNAQQGAMQGVGFESPGFGSVAELSSPEQIDRINASGADLVVVSLGAKKGQTWIEHNRHLLKPPLISALGAVVNFVAGSVHRAPLLWRQMGLEWLWRIKEEPSLWRRYAHDGRALARLGLTEALPCAVAVGLHKVLGSRVPARHTVTRADGHAVIHLTGDWTFDALPVLKQELAMLLSQGATTRFDLAKVTWIDSATLGLLLLVQAWQGVNGCVVTPSSALTPAVRRLIRWHGANALVGG